HRHKHPSTGDTTMKQRELKNCASCGQGVMHDGCPLFFRISVEEHNVDLNAVQRQAGLEVALGSPDLAQIMGPDADISKKISEQQGLIVCFECASKMPLFAIGVVEEEDVPF